MKHIQSLVNAQGEVNRAVFLMNARNNREHYARLLDDADLADDKIAGHIRDAARYLSLALAGYESQPDLFSGVA